MELTHKLIDAWQWELAVQIKKCRDGGTDQGQKKADVLEGVYTALTCLDRAMAGKVSANPLDEHK